MRRTTETTRILTTAALAIVVLAGCGSSISWMDDDEGDESRPVATTESQTNPYLKDMYDMVNGDLVTQAEIAADAKAQSTLTPDPSTNLRYALVLATPGHSDSNPLVAQSMLRELLAQTELLTTTEIELATIHLKEVEARMVLGSETSRLRSENARAATTEEAAVAERIARIEAENGRLRDSLNDAEQKLEAITSIERSVRDQSGSE